jgi:hypothetical protein
LDVASWSRHYFFTDCDAYDESRKVFERHFQEQRHAFGMKALGLPNTKHFHEITKIEDAIARSFLPLSPPWFIPAHVMSSIQLPKSSSKKVNRKRSKLRQWKSSRMMKEMCTIER